MLDAPCDRCGRKADLHPWKFTQSITYRNKQKEMPWLCAKCFLIEKRKLWKKELLLDTALRYATRAFGG